METSVAANSNISLLILLYPSSIAYRIPDPVHYSWEGDTVMTWSGAKQLCESHGRQLCNSKEICVNDTLVETEGEMDGERWAPTK